MNDQPAVSDPTLFQALSPQIFDAAERIRSGKKRLVHYTSAENALNIINKEEFWLRNVRCMNDYSEVQHGINLIVRAFTEEDGKRRERLVSTLDKVAPGAALNALQNFDAWINRLPHETFIGCLSEFDIDDSFGRLSMWRAYSTRGAGVALVMNPWPFVAITDELKAYSVPVEYLSDSQFFQRIDDRLEQLEKDIANIANLGHDAISHDLFWWLVFTAVSLKHPAFIEEREWRVLYIPSMGKSKTIKSAVESIGGIPQVVQKIPLLNRPDLGLYGADLNSLLFKLIVGPSEFPLVLMEAFENALSDKGIIDPASRISVSFIPLRQ